MMKPLLTVIFLMLYTHTILSNNQQVNDTIKAEENYMRAAELIYSGDFSEAVQLLKISSGLWEKLYTKESYEFGIAEDALGIAYNNLGSFDNALEHFLKAEKAYKSEPNMDIFIARLYNNIGNVYFNKLNYKTAADYYINAIDILEKNKISDSSSIAGIYYSLANANHKLKKYKYAISIIDEQNTKANSDTKIMFWNLRAMIYEDLKEFNKSYNDYRKVIQLSEKHYTTSDLDLIYNYLNFANFLIKHDEFEEAQDFLQKVRELLAGNNTTQGVELSFYYKNLGDFHKNRNVDSKSVDEFVAGKVKNLKEAVNSYEKGLEALGTDAHALNITQILSGTLSLTQNIELLELIGDAYLKISEIYESNQQKNSIEPINKALDYYKLTSNLIQQARKEIYSDESKIELSALAETTFYKIIRTAFMANEISPNSETTAFAFQTAERMKASAVFDRLSDQLAQKGSLMPDSLAELERMLNYNISKQNENLFYLRQEAEPDLAEIAKADSMLFLFKKQREELNRYMEKNYSDYFQLKYSDKTITPAQIRQRLGNNELVIEYVFNETGSIPELYAFGLSKDSEFFQKIEIKPDFTQSLKTTFEFLSNPGYLFTQNEDAIKYCAAAHHLYKKLIYPFEKLAHNNRITIIPDGKLNYLPFYALLTEMPDTTNQILFNHLPYLIKNSIISYSYSANLLYSTEKSNRKTGNSVLAFAPVYNSDTIFFENEKYILTPLPGVQREVDFISEEIKTRVFRGEEATESNFREFSKGYDILHLAMHAFINDSLPAFSRFSFSQNKNNLSENDGWLNTADIYNLDLDARLTVLSACNTGIGNLKKGEGVMSLARGFLYAGCPGIIMTLWEVEDNAGTKIMSNFYRNLKKGKHTDEALRAAQLNYLKNANPRMGHPHYWLGYVTIGQTSPLFKSWDFYFAGLLALTLTGLVVDQIIRLRRNRKIKRS